LVIKHQLSLKNYTKQARLSVHFLGGRSLGTQKKKRSSCAFYLSTSKNGKTKLQHISKNKLEEVKMQVAEWKKYQQNLRQWRELIKTIDQDFKKLGKIQNQLNKEK